MNSKVKIALVYGAVALICAIILALSSFLTKGLGPKPAARQPEVIATGKATEEKWFPITRDLEGVNQLNEPVKLSDLKGKVVLIAEFFAICPHCAQRNGAELREIYDAFKDHPDFHIVCITVDPKTDHQEKLKDYAGALGADAKNWWFMNAGDEKTTHDYLEKELKFFGIRERRDPADIEANGRFSHDLAFMLVDKDWQVIGKWPIADARSEEAKKRQPELYDQLKHDLHERINAELSGEKPVDP
jgi:protein SCO1/2